MENLTSFEQKQINTFNENYSITENKNTEKTANIILIDSSESTESPIGRGDIRQKIIGIQEASSLFISTLPPSCYVSIIKFDSKATLLWPMERLSDNKLSVIQKIQQITPGGSTSMKEAIIIANEEIPKSPDGYTVRVYLLSDGIPDSDPTNAAEALKSSGARLYTIGFGDGQEINLSLLERIATITDEGKKLFYHFVDINKMSLLFKKESQTIQ